MVSRPTSSFRDHMKNAGFPARRDDGTFSVAMRFRAQSTLGTENVQKRIEEWIALTSELWHRSFGDEFSAVPRAESRPEGIVEVTFEGRSGSSFWRDWFVYLCQDLERSFDGLVHVSIQDLVSARETWRRHGD